MKTLNNPRTDIVIKFLEKEYIENLSKGEIFISKLSKYKNTELRDGISDTEEGVSKLRIRKLIAIYRGIIRIYADYYSYFKTSDEYPIWCLYNPRYKKIDSSKIKIKFNEEEVKDLSEYSYALIIDSKKLFKRISDFCDGIGIIFSYFNVIYGKTDELVQAPYQKSKRYKHQREIRYVFLENKFIGYNEDGVGIYPPYKISGENAIINIGDISDISEVVEVKKLDGHIFTINKKSR